MTARTKTMRMIPNTFTQRGVLGGDPRSGFVEVCDMIISPCII